MGKKFGIYYNFSLSSDSLKNYKQNKIYFSKFSKLKSYIKKIENNSQIQNIIVQISKKILKYKKGK